MHSLKFDKYRPCFSGHETFPLRYGWLQKAYRATVESTSASDAALVFRSPESIARFGVGRNMVAAIRYWATASGVLKDTKSGLETGWLGDMLFGEAGTDPYLEEDASLWLLHWNLAGQTRLTSAYWLFNEFRGGSFVRQDVVSSLLELSRECSWSRVAPTTVDRDLQCLLRAYVGGRGSSESDDSLLAELGLLRPVDKHRFRLARGRKRTLPDSVFTFCLNAFWESTVPGQATMSFESVAYLPGSPGRVFLLNEEDIVSRLERIGEVSGGAFIWSETAGLRQIIRKEKRSDSWWRIALRDALSGEARMEAA